MADREGCAAHEELLVLIDEFARCGFGASPRRFLAAIHVESGLGEACLGLAYEVTAAGERLLESIRLRLGEAAVDHFLAADERATETASELLANRESSFPGAERIC